MCQSASRVKLILGLSSTSKVEDLWTTRLGPSILPMLPVFMNRCGAERHVELIPSDNNNHLGAIYKVNLFGAESFLHSSHAPDWRAVASVD